jgi:hypothetical protein
MRAGLSDDYEDENEPTNSVLGRRVSLVLRLSVTVTMEVKLSVFL